MKAPLILGYGKKRTVLERLPQKLLGILRPAEMACHEREAGVISAALQNLPDFVRPASKVLIIGSDFTRKVGTDKFAPCIIEAPLKLGFKKSQIKVLFSTGLHRAQTEEEKRALLGESFGQIEAADHNCDARMASYGSTSFGTEILLNPLVDWADAIILTGGINFHYFAGFTGGRKALLPGVAERKSILQNHRLIFSRKERGFHPKVRPGQIEGNPVAEDLQEAADIVAGKKRLYLFNTVLDSAGKICRVFSGDYKSDFMKGCAFFKALNSIKIQKKAELVIASAGGYPYDTNLIQSHKALFHAFQAVREGGILILLAECSDGLTGKGREKDRDFSSYFNQTLGQMDKIFRHDFDQNCNTAYSIAEKASQAKMILVSGLETELVRRMKLIPAGNLSEAFELVQKLSPSGIPETYVIPNAATLLPVLV
ncbi:MAG: hypothetical protein A2Z27_00100 [candidate division Zixibacteria bacterium RBG_16_50_21]|nr:MAG: hypothetical protein A2Z27_00100 [candidate division Zixibacteria bacterium RBG_16_50_21]